jgi:hypothetical protein
MDILNFISWIKGKGYFTTVDPQKTLVPLGKKDASRDDQYLPGAMTMENFEPALNGYTEYVALLTQRGVVAPNAVELKNNLGVTATYAYFGVGGYIMIFSEDIFNSPNEYVTITSGVTDSGTGDSWTTNAVPILPDVLLIESFINGTAADDVIGADFVTGFPCVLTIRKYN